MDAREAGPGRDRHPGAGYDVLGACVRSYVPLAAPPSARAAADVVVAPGDPTGRAPRDDGWHPVGPDPAAPFCWIASADAGLVLDFPGSAQFVVRDEGRAVDVHAEDGVPGSTLHHLLLDHVLPRVFGLRGTPVLHAGAVVAAGGALLFTGPSGAGKSTLVAALRRAGHPVLCDDTVRLVERDGAPAVYGGYPGLRLWEDSAREVLTPDEGTVEVAHYTSKRFAPLRDDAPRAAPTPVRRIYYLEPAEEAGAEVEIRPIGAAAAFARLVQEILRLDFENATLVEQEFATLTRLGGQRVHRTLRYPRDFGALDRVCAAILREAASGSGAAP